jgi:hypothetical protein
MKQNPASRQPDLFDVDDYQTSPIPSQKEQLAALVEVLLREIAAALAAGRSAMTKIRLTISRAAPSSTSANRRPSSSCTTRRAGGQYGLADRANRATENSAQARRAERPAHDHTPLAAGERSPFFAATSFIRSRDRARPRLSFDRASAYSRASNVVRLKAAEAFLTGWPPTIPDRDPPPE